MKLLLDTHAALWWLSDDDRLGDTSTQLMTDASNEVLLAITLSSNSDARTVPAAIACFTGSTQFEEPLGTISAASVVISVPLIIAVLLFQKRIVAGLTAGAVKG